MERMGTGEPDDIYGMHLLTHISSEIASKNMSRLVIPVVLLSGLDREWSSNSLPSPSLHGSQVLTDTVRLVRYLDAGATDALSSPLSKDSVHGLVIHAYRVHKEVAREEASFLTTKRNRKLSWVGVNDQKPYAYLREAMVSSLMSGICNPETVGESLDSKYNVPMHLLPRPILTKSGIFTLPRIGRISLREQSVLGLSLPMISLMTSFSMVPC